MKDPKQGAGVWEDLFHRVMDGAARAEDLAQFHDVLRQNPEAVDAWIRLTHLHAELASGVLLEGANPLPREARPEGEGGSVVRSIPVEIPWRRHLGRIAAALVVGLLLGGFGTSVLRGVSELRWGKLATLLADSFESDVAPVVTGPSEHMGVWSGDVTQMVGAQQGVQPRSGSRMLRFVSAAHEGTTGETGEKGSYIADVYRLLDLRPFAKELAPGDLSLRFSAYFNANGRAERDAYTARIYLHALSEATIRKGLLQSSVQQLLQESLAATLDQISVDRDPATWQRRVAELRLPPQTEFVWVHVSIIHPGGRSPDGPRTFSGHFLDDAEAALLRRDVGP
ncbi:MAG: hypothetical protein RLZZ142_1702 [Verrucomicrobiota bacterium]